MTEEMTIEILKPLGDFRGDAVLVRRSDGEHFAVSTVTPFDTNKEETLAFPCDAEGEVSDWGGMAGGIGVSREETIKQLASGENLHDELMNDWLDDMGGVFPAMLSTLSRVATYTEADGESK